MNRTHRLLTLLAVLAPMALALATASAAMATASAAMAQEPPARETREVEGWSVAIDRRLLAPEAKATTKRAMDLLQAQLLEIVRVVPEEAVAKLRRVKLYLSPQYPGIGPTAEYHPGAQWLKDHGRDPAMVKSVEFTNVSIFPAEIRRMPNFVLHELAHAYHHQVLGNHRELVAAYERAKASKSYEDVERQDAEGRKHRGRHYALSNVQEYFAEASEAFFVRNDFYPYTRDELIKHDPEAARLVARLWGAPLETPVPRVTAPPASLKAPPFYKKYLAANVSLRRARWSTPCSCSIRSSLNSWLASRPYLPR